MLDLNFIRQHPDAVAANAQHRGVAVDVPAILALDRSHRALITQQEQLRAEQKSASRTKPDAPTRQRLHRLSQRIEQLRVQQRQTEAELKTQLERLPNLATPDTPVGSDASGNVVLRTVGTPRRFTFQPKEHGALGVALGVMDFARASRVAGSRFAYLFGDLVWLQFALIQLTLAVATDRRRLQAIIKRASLRVPLNPFALVIPPVFIRPAVLQGMARLEPKEERYYIPSDDLYLAGSAEHTLGPLHQGEVIEEARLPIRYLGYATAFRREAGSYGQDVRGMLRVHQFDKLEFSSFTVAEQSLGEQNFLVAIQEHLLRQLKLPYRAVLMCTGDMGAPDARQIDLETWLPGQGRYRETHTADLNTDYQARRLNIRVKRQSGAIELVHMNDATACAIGRTLIAIVENYQQSDGSVAVPRALRPYLPQRLRVITPRS